MSSAPKSPCLPSAGGVSWTEAERLEALDRYAILDTGREAAFDDVAELAADILDAPIAVVNFIAADRQWFKAEKGIGQDSLPLDVSICRHAILQSDMLVVPDLTLDARFDHNPLVTAAGGLRFYAGALLETSDGLPLGTVCVLDRVARPQGITARQERALRALAAQAMVQLELRRSDANARRENQRLAAMFAQATVGMSEVSLTGQFLTVNDRLCEILGRSREELLTIGFADVTSPSDLASNVPIFDRMVTHGESFRVDKRYVRPDGSIVWANSAVTRLLDEAGVPRAALAVTTDITERKMEERRRAFILKLTDLTRHLVDPGAVIAATTRALGEELGATRVVYAEIDDARNRATVQGDWTDGDAAHLPASIDLDDFGQGLVGRLRSGGTLCVTDTALNPHTRDDLAALDAIGVRSIVSVPLFKNDCFVVNLNVHQATPRAWTDADVELIEAVAERTWEAVERARIESALRESEERHRKIVEGAEDFAIISLDDRGVIRSWNTGAERITLFAEANAIGQSGEIFFTDADRAAGVPEQEIERARREGRAVNERWHRREDGSEFWGSGLLMRLDSADGGFLKIFRDRTAEHQAEARLRTLNETLEQRVLEVAAERERAWHLSQELLAVAEQDGTFAEINAAWTALLGWEPHELLGHQFASFTHPDDLEATTAKFAETFERPLVVPFEYRFRRKDGGYRWFAWTATFEEGRVYASGRDVNAVKEQQAELEVAQEALRQAQKMEAMGQLTGGVAHDFNNLLTPIIGSLDMLMRRGLGDDREQRLIAGAMQSAERAATLVQRLLAFARRQPLQAVPVDIGDLVKGMAELVASTTGPQIKVVVDAPEDLPPAKADPNQLEMALLNLAVNARDAMPAGGTLRVTVSAAQSDTPRPIGLKAGDFILLSVADTGTGMDETTLARAVEPFFSTKGIGKGTGLGLSMAHGLASQLGGALTIQSQPRLGTNVELWLPISTTLPTPNEPLSDTVKAPAALGVALLVDDEELVRLSTADMLVDLGYAVVEAADGEEALRIMNEGGRIDLLVTDHLMPGMTGTDLARTIRAARPGLPVLIVSGYAERDGIDPDLPRLSKPFRKDDLAASLAQLSPA